MPAQVAVACLVSHGQQWSLPTWLLPYGGATGYGCCWLLLAAAGCCFLLLAVAACCWLLLAVATVSSLFRC